jgi:hypothetical protein
MYALLGEDDVRIFDGQSITYVAYGSFFENYSKIVDCKIVLNLLNVDFSLNKLKNCYFVDAYRALLCARSALEFFEYSFIVKKNKLNIFKRSDFYIQKITINNREVFEKIFNGDGVIFIEQIIADFCKSIVEINESTWWIYIAKDSVNSVKIVSGIGNGIVLSRILKISETNYSKAVIQTFQYLKRHGLNTSVKIILDEKIASIADGFQNIDCEIYNIDIKNVSNKFLQQECCSTESVLINFFSENKKIRTTFSTESCFNLFLKNQKNKIIILLSACILIAIFTFIKLSCRVLAEENMIGETEIAKEIVAEDLSKTLKVKINGDNFAHVRKIINILEEAGNPLEILGKVSKFIGKNKICVEELLFENNDVVQENSNIEIAKKFSKKQMFRNKSAVKLKCTINNKLANDIKKISGKRFDIAVNKINKPHDEYEKIDDSINENFGAEICIKIR